MNDSLKRSCTEHDTDLQFVPTGNWRGLAPNDSVGAHARTMFRRMCAERSVEETFSKAIAKVGNDGQRNMTHAVEIAINERPLASGCSYQQLCAGAAARVPGDHSVVELGDGGPATMMSCVHKSLIH